MFSHVTVGTNDLERARAFYDAVFATIGVVRRWAYPTAIGYVFKDDHRPQFWVMKPFDENVARPGNGLTSAFIAPDRAAVDAAYATAMRHGGRDEGPPGLRLHYHPHYYGAYMRDPDGNKFCVCCHEPYPGDRAP